MPEHVLKIIKRNLNDLKNCDCEETRQAIVESVINYMEITRSQVKRLKIENDSLKTKIRKMVAIANSQAVFEINSEFSDDESLDDEL